MCFLVLILLSSCKQEPKWKTIVGESDGVTLINNPARPKFNENILKLEEDLSIGVDEGDENYMFSSPIDIDSDSKGNIYILDYKELTVKKYDNKGVFKNKIAGQGQGPGELEYPYSFCIDLNDLIYILDFMEQRIEVFDSDGVYQDAIKLDVRAENIAVNPANELILNHDETIFENEKTMRRISRIGRLQVEKDLITDFFSLNKPGFKAIQRAEYRVETPYERFAVDSRGYVSVGTTNKYEISVYNAEGQLTRKFARDFRPISLESEIMKKVMAQLSQSTPGNQLEEYRQLLKNYKIFENISADERDRIWIIMHQPPIEKLMPKDTLIDIFSSEGEYLNQLRIAKKIERQVIFKNGYAYALILNEMGFPRAVRFKIIEKMDH